MVVYIYVVVNGLFISIKQLQFKVPFATVASL